MRPFPVVVLAASLLATAARADPSSDAKDLFERARQLRAAGKCAEAAPLFEKAATVYPAGLGSIRNAAECEEQLGHFATSHRMWLDLKRAVMLSRDPKYTGWQADAEAAAARLAPKLARVTVHLTPANTGSNVEVKINGEVVAAELIGAPLERDPGKYVVSVGGDGQPTREQTVDIGAGEAKELTFTVSAVTPPPPVPVGDPTPVPPHDLGGGDPPPSTGAATRRTVGWIGVGVGAAALVGASISLGIRQAALGDLKSACPKYQTETCPTSLQSTVSRGATASTLVNVLAIAGGIVGVTGVLLVVLSPSSPSRAKERTSYVPEISVGLGAFSARWSFQ